MSTFVLIAFKAFDIGFLEATGFGIYATQSAVSHDAAALAPSLFLIFLCYSLWKDVLESATDGTNLRRDGRMQRISTIWLDHVSSLQPTLPGNEFGSPSGTEIRTRSVCSAC